MIHPRSISHICLKEWLIKSHRTQTYKQEKKHARLLLISKSLANLRTRLTS
uniref:Uncharacterized protein n=1 Tax=Arundo donax TaxID=35708 RepID=A0A0A9EDJ2_ARUDO